MAETVSTMDAARSLKVSRATLVRLIQAGEIKAEKKGLGTNSAYLVDAASVSAYRAKRQQGSAPRA